MSTPAQPQAPITPMVDDLVLPLVQQLATTEAQSLVIHPIPGLPGNLTQHLSRATTRVTLEGVLDSDASRTDLEQLRAKFQAAAPVSFVADIMTATQVQRMLIADLVVREGAGKPDRFGYRLTLSEYVPPPPDETTALQAAGDQASADAADLNNQQVDDVNRDMATLEVEVDLGDGGDYTGVAVVVEGSTDQGQDFATRTEEQTGGVYQFTAVPAGTYTVRLEVR